MKLRSFAALLIRMSAILTFVNGFIALNEAFFERDLKRDFVVGGLMGIASGLLFYRYSKQCANFLCRDLEE